MKNCSNCLLPETHETIAFDSKGTCNICTQHVFKEEKIDWETKKEELISEIDDLKNKFVDAIRKFRERAEYKNNLLDEHINQLNETYNKREMEIEEILKEVDNIAGMDNSTHSQGPFGRGMISEMMENIRGVLITKTQIIKNLKYSLHLATKVKSINFNLFILLI